jgi:hypothetical protein
MEINFDAVVQNFIISYTNDPMFDILPDDRNVLTFDATAPWIVISVMLWIKDLIIFTSEKYCVKYITTRLEYENNKTYILRMELFKLQNQVILYRLELILVRFCRKLFKLINTFSSPFPEPTNT